MTLRTYRRLRSRSVLKKRSDKPKTPSVLHPHKRVPVDGAAWERIKDQVFERSGGSCEKIIRDGARIRRCLGRIFRFTFEPHHVLHRSKGGPDTVENVQAWCRACHDREHGVPQWSRK